MAGAAEMSNSLGRSYKVEFARLLHRRSPITGKSSDQKTRRLYLCAKSIRMREIIIDVVALDLGG